MAKLILTTIDRTKDAEEMATYWLGKTESSAGMCRFRLKDGVVTFSGMIYRTDFLYGYDSSIGGKQFFITEGGRQYNRDMFPDENGQMMDYLWENLDFVRRQVHYIKSFYKFEAENRGRQFTVEQAIVECVRIRAMYDRAEADKMLGVANLMDIIEDVVPEKAQVAKKAIA